MKMSKRHSLRFLAMILSAILITGSLSGSVFGAQKTGDYEDTVRVESASISGETEVTDETEKAGNNETANKERNTDKADPEALDEKENVDDAEAVSGEKTDAAEKDNSDDTDKSDENSNAPETAAPSGSDQAAEAEQPSGDPSEETGEDIGQNDAASENPEFPQEETTDEITDGPAASDEEAEDLQKDPDNTSDEAQENNQDIIEAAPVQETITTEAQKSDVTDFIIEDDEVVQYIGSDSVVMIPKGITGIRANAFKNRRVLSVMLQDGVTYIGDNAFQDCSTLRSVHISSGLTSIGMNAFRGCSNLETIYIPDSVTRIGSYAFLGCYMCTIYCPSSAVYVMEYACKNSIQFYGQTEFTIIDGKLISYNRSSGIVTVPNNVTVIGEGAFSRAYKVTDVILPDSTTVIEDEAFSGCKYLETITFSNVTKIGKSAFNRCVRLKGITIPDGVTTIERNAFNTCYALSYVTLPESVTSIEDTAFARCRNLKNIKLPSGVKSIGKEAFFSCANLERIDIPASVTYIGSNAFTSAPYVVIHCPASAEYVIDYAEKWNIPYETYSVPAEKVTLDKSSATLYTGKSLTLKATVSPADATNKAVTWTSSDNKIAKVNSAGTVTAVAKGKATITAASKDNSSIKAACTITVIQTKPTIPTLKKPGNCHFVKWNNSKYTSCRIAWNKTANAEGYQTLLSWTDGSHASSTIVKSNVLYRNCTVHPQHVSQMKVRAFYIQNGQRKYGPWSNVEYITPSPTRLTTKNAGSGTNLKMNINWNIIYGCNGYNVFITTNPNGTWYWNQSTPINATATKATITKYRGSKLKKNTRYYVRIVTRRKRNGVFCTVPMPAKNTYIGSFIIK